MRSAPGDGLRTGVAVIGLALTVFSVAGCGSTSRGAADYPIVRQQTVAMQEPITMPNGAVVTLPRLPTEYEIPPGQSCERTLATYHDGTTPARRPIVIPPTPGLKAIATTTHTTRVEWSFHDLPADCSPAFVAIAVTNGSDPRASPRVEQIDVNGAHGSTDITYYDFLPAPNVVRASAYTRDGHRSRTVSVLIERPANTPADPVEPTPSATAPAGRPATCTGHETVVGDPATDILTYSPGSPPSRLPHVPSRLLGADITRATVQIDGRTICASFDFSRSPTDPSLSVRITLRDTTHSSCCAGLLFRHSRGTLEVGSELALRDGTHELRPVGLAGAAIHGTTLTITGTLPPPTTWPTATRQMPTADNLAWSATATLTPDEYGPYFGDWLPSYSATNEPIIRHENGVTVRPAH